MHASSDGAPVLIGVAGGSASGKSTFAEILARTAGRKHAGVLTMDRFYLPKRARTDQDAVNFDHPAAIDFQLLRSVIQMLHSGRSASVPIYDYAIHDRTGCEPMRSTRVIIVEGILALSDPTIRRLMKLAIFVETPDHVRYHRRLTRDVRERGRTPRSVSKQWTTSVLPMHNEYVAPTKQHADVILDGCSDFTEAATSMLQIAGILPGCSRENPARSSF
jgi:uridine kinase